MKNSVYDFIFFDNQEPNKILQLCHRNHQRGVSIKIPKPRARARAHIHEDVNICVHIRVIKLNSTVESDIRH